MEMHATEIQPGMDVYAGDGGRLGTIEEVYPDIRVPTSSFSTEETTVAGYVTPGAIGSGLVAGTTASGYFTVSFDRGASDESALYIPYTEIAGIAPGRRVTLNESLDACKRQYASKPHVLT